MRIGQWPLGCQARPWLQTLGREALVARLPEVMGEIAAIGFAGFETALACLPLDDPAAFQAASAAANSLQLSGAHAGGRWWDPAAASEIAALVAQARRLTTLGCHQLVLSMAAPPENDDAALECAVTTLRDLGRACRAEAGVAVAFHNHARELADDARFFQLLTARCTPEEVGLGADLGWVAHAGVDVGDFLRRFGSHVTYLHVRDVSAYGPAGTFREVGQGVLDYGAILGALDQLGYTGWLVAESEFTPHWDGLTDPQETAARQFAGLRQVIGTT
ncbi:MAG: sugar phosphate isomerase/epimerase family protein [Thermomicrobiales bacterium]